MGRATGSFPGPSRPGLRPRQPRGRHPCRPLSGSEPFGIIQIRCRENVACLLLAIAAFGAEKDQWAKVRDLLSGTELRVFKHGARQPLLVKLDQANANSLIVVLKNEQIAIAKKEIDCIDYRPPRTSGRVVTETKTGDDKPAGASASPAHPQPADVPGRSTSSNVSISGKPDFETIYRKWIRRL